MIKIAHESPKAIFDKVQRDTHIDYALVHLFEEDEEYFNLFVDAVEKEREVILDNSIFELETAFDADRFEYWIDKLKPTWYIIPDALEDKDKTIDQLASWLVNKSKVEGKKIGVVQGKSYEEIVECYRYVQPLVDMTAISFDYSCFEEWFPDEPSKQHSWVKGRQQLLQRMLDEGVIDTNHPHHLLGCGLPQEFAYYKNWSWIYSVDTSNPVVAGLKGMKYQMGDYGIWKLDTKPSEKLFTLINSDVTSEQSFDILYNINSFKVNLMRRN